MNFILSLLLGLLSLGAFAQSIPLEGMLGHKYYWYQQVAVGNFSNSSPFGFFHTSSLHAYYDRQQSDEVMTQSYLTYRLSSWLTAALGTFYTTGPGITPTFSLQLLKQHNHFTVLVAPRIDLWKKANYELMTLVEYKPPVGEKVNLYTRLQVMSNYGPNGHNRSYQNVRAGVDLKKVALGLALNVDEYGGEAKTGTNLGLFIRKELY